jgi:hypothetical protein
MAEFRREMPNAVEMLLRRTKRDNIFLKPREPAFSGHTRPAKTAGKQPWKW